MSFLGRAKKFLQELGTEGPRTQAFNLACASGHRVRGERTEGYQALRCPSCGEGVFVLPRSPLPEPEPPAGATRPRSSYGRGRGDWADDDPIALTDVPIDAVGPDDGDGPDVAWDEGPAGAPPRRAARVAPEDLAAAEIEEARAAAEELDRRRDRPAAPAAASRPSPRRRSSSAEPIVVEERPRSRPIPRPAKVFALLALLIVASVGWRAWRNHRAQLPLIVERGRTEGIPALEGGEFDLADHLLSAARSAVDSLGGAIDGADEVRHAADEAAVFNDLGPDALEDLLAEAGRPSSSGEDWESRFEKLYKRRYYLFDSFVTATPDDGGAYEIGYKVFPPGEASRFGDGKLPLPDRYARIDLDGFRLFELAGPRKGTHITFGARLRAIDYDGEHKEWVVRLEPEGGVIITHLGALRASGWPVPEAVELPTEEQP